MTCLFCEAPIDPHDVQPPPEANVCPACYEGLQAARAAFHAAIGRLVAKRRPRAVQES